MKKKLVVSLLILTGLLVTHCASAQWVLSTNPKWIKTNCPLGPKALTVHDKYLFAGSEGGVMRSSDNGNTWQTVNIGLSHDMNPSTILSLCSLGNNLLAGGDNFEGLYLSTDDADKWGRPLNDVSEATSFIVHDNFIFGAEGNGTMRLSADSGYSWIDVDTTYGERIPFVDYDISCMSMTCNANYIFGGSDDGIIYRSSDNGSHWTEAYTANDKAPQQKYVYALGAIASNILASIGDSLIRSIDNGNHWELVYSAGMGPVTFITYKNIIFAGGYFGITYSSDSGKSWKPVNTGLPDSVVIDAFAIQNDFLFAGAYETFPLSAGGLWKIPLSEFTDKVSIENVTSSISITDCFPNPSTTSTRISYSLPARCEIQLEAFDVMGRLLTTIEIGVRDAGSNDVVWDTKLVPSGSYIIRLNACGESFTKVVDVVK